jgi:hypothetical protein
MELSHADILNFFYNPKTGIAVKLYGLLPMHPENIDVRYKNALGYASTYMCILESPQWTTFNHASCGKLEKTEGAFRTQMYYLATFFADSKKEMNGLRELQQTECDALLFTFIEYGIKGDITNLADLIDYMADEDIDRTYFTHLLSIILPS